MDNSQLSESYYSDKDAAILLSSCFLLKLSLPVGINYTVAYVKSNLFNSELCYLIAEKEEAIAQALQVLYIIYTQVNSIS